MASGFKRSNGIYYVTWLDPATGKRLTRSTKSTRKRTAEQTARQLQQQPEQPREQPLSVLAENWLDELKALGRTPKHVSSRERAVRILGLDVPQINRQLGQRSEWSDRTVAKYVTSLRQFGEWCLENGHRRRNPMCGLKKPPRRTGRVYIRGAFTREEATILCTSDNIQKTHRTIYTVALSTGLRIGELRNLKRENIKTNGTCFSIHLAPRQVKNRFESVIPISEAVYSILSNQSLDLDDFKRSAEALRKDMRAAGLPGTDRDGHQRDFHSLRVTYCNLLIESGTSIPMVARMMRHSDGGALLLRQYAGGHGNAVPIQLLRRR